MHKSPFIYTLLYVLSLFMPSFILCDTVIMTTDPAPEIINKQVIAFIESVKAPKSSSARHHPRSTQNFKQTVTVHIHFDLHDGDHMYADYIGLSSGSPYVTLSPWQSTTEPISRYDPLFKRVKKVYTQPFTLVFAAEISSINNTLPYKALIHVTYYKKSDNRLTHVTVPLISIAKHTSDNTSTTLNNSSTTVDDALHMKTKRIKQVSCQPLVHFIQSAYPWGIMLIGIVSAWIHTTWVRKYRQAQNSEFAQYAKILWCILTAVCICIVYAFTI